MATGYWLSFSTHNYGMLIQSIVDGGFAPNQIRKMGNEKVLMISRMNFYREVRNPLYCGKIVIKKFKDEEEHMVNGLHEPLISESLFHKVQDMLDGRKIVLRSQAIKLNEALHLQ